MKRSHIALVAVLLIGISVVGFSIALLPVGPSFTDLSWVIELEDTLDYELEVTGTSYYFQTYDYYNTGPLNNTIIHVRVENLPSLDMLTSQSDFTTQIIEGIKITGTFLNGSELTTWATANILPTISSCFLPNGSWSTIDSIYPNEFPQAYNPGSHFYTTILFEDYLQLNYQWSGSIDDGGGWSGNISLTTGIATQINYYYYHAGSHSYSIDLTLVS